MAGKNIVRSSLLDTQNLSSLGIGCVTVFLLMFVILFCGFGGWGVYQQLRVHQFLPVQGEVTHSEVGVNRSTEGSTFYPDIRFRYTVDGQTHDTGEYRIQVISSSGQGSKQEIVRRHPVGSKVQAWYDPAKPEVAVIDNSFSFFPVIFLAIGVIVLGIIIGLWVWHMKGGPQRLVNSRLERVMSSLPEHQADAVPEPRGHDVRLKSYERGPYVSSFKERAIFCAGWNALMWTIALMIWFFDDNNEVPWWSWLFLILFLLIGIYLIIKTIMMSMARMKLFEPTLTASVYPLRPDESFLVHYSQRARQPVYVERVVVRLVCRKWDTSDTSGDCDPHMDSHDLYESEHEIARDIQVDTRHPIDVTLELHIPEDGMDTCYARLNQISWLLEVCVSAVSWPDYTETFELKVESEPLQTA